MWFRTTSENTLAVIEGNLFGGGLALQIILCGVGPKIGEGVKRKKQKVGKFDKLDTV